MFKVIFLKIKFKIDIFYLLFLSYRSQFNCQKSKKCLPYWLKCDGYSDCNYNEDETNCPTELINKCPKHGMFSCGFSSVCIDPKNVCDGVNNCPYGIDEKNCGIYPFCCYV